MVATLLRARTARSRAARVQRWQRAILTLAAFCATLWLFPTQAHAQASEQCLESKQLTLCLPASTPPLSSQVSAGTGAHAITPFQIEQAPMCGADATSVNAPPPLLPSSRAALQVSPGDDQARQDRGAPGFDGPRSRQASKPELQRAVLLGDEALPSANSVRAPRIFHAGTARVGVSLGLYRPPRRG